MGDLGSIPGLRRSPGEGKGYPLQHSGLEDSMDYRVQHGVAKSRTRVSNFHFHLWVVVLCQSSGKKAEQSGPDGYYHGEKGT